MARRRRTAGSVAIHGTLIVLGLLTVYPIVFMLCNAVRSGTQTAAAPFGLSWPPLWANMSAAWNATSGAFGTSAFIVGVSVFGILTVALLAAHAFVRFRFPEKEAFFYVFFALLLVPGFLTLIPLFVEIRDLGLLNSAWGLILPYIAMNQAFAIFVLRTFIASIPRELFEAAVIDGAGEWRIFLRLVVPLSTPVLVTLALLNVVGLWSDFVLPSLVLASGHETLAMAIANLQPPPDVPSISAFNIQLAAFTWSSVPIALLFVFLMKYFVAGATNGALKM